MQKATYNDFLNYNSNYDIFANNKDAIEVFNLLSEDDSIFAMIDSADKGRPALEGCVEKVEDWFDEEPFRDIDLCDEFTKEAIGSMVNAIIAPFGYKATVIKPVERRIGPFFFKNALCYEKSGTARLKVVREIAEL